MITQISTKGGSAYGGKKQITLIVLLVFGFWFLVSQCYAQNFIKKEGKIVIEPPQKALKIGEKLQYSIEWLGIPVGKIILSAQDIVEIDGSECYHIVAHAIPNKFFTKLYDVEYTVHTYIDKKTFYTHRFEKTRRIKDKFNYVVIDFDREKKEVKYKTKGSAPLVEFSSIREEVQTNIPVTYKIINGTQDLFSSLYYLRLLEMKEKGPYAITIYYDQRNWPVEVKTEEPFFREIRNMGTFAVFGVSMDSNLGKFILGKSKMFVYFTTDSRRIPLEFKFGAGVGLIRGVIQDISK